MLSHPYPILEHDPSPDAIIDPRRFFKGDEAPERVVVCFFQDVISRLADSGRLRKLGAGSSEMGAHPYYLLEGSDPPVAVFHPGVGAALAVGLLEEMIARGGKKFIACGGCGVLEKEIAVGHVLIPTEAVRDEGTSYHYLPPSRTVQADPAAVAAIEQTLQNHGVEYLRCKVWTTDAFYRETTARVAARRAEGCLAVEMEAAAFFAVAHFRHVTFGQILYGGDAVIAGEWDGRDWVSRLDVREQLLWLAVETVQAL